MGLWAISAYFNPASYLTRRINYRLFREALEVPLLTVELSRNGGFELGTGDADILIQVQEPSVLWQKERLLNLALEALPDSCDAVAWLDCDIVFGSKSWASDAFKALENHRWLQLFSELRDLASGEIAGQPVSGAGAPLRRSVIQMVEAGDLPENFFSLRGASLQWRFSAGHAWAARRDALQSVGFYDAAIMGSGNKLMLAAGYGGQQEASTAYMFNDHQRRHYLDWAGRFGRAVGEPGFIAGSLAHLWHGDLAHRAYGKRHEILHRFNFDPFSDIEKAESGAWRWCSDKAGLHQCVEDFFQQRKEDG